jgi:hypothetical protein
VRSKHPILEFLYDSQAIEDGSAWKASGLLGGTVALIGGAFLGIALTCTHDLCEYTARYGGCPRMRELGYPVLPVCSRAINW